MRAKHALPAALVAGVLAAPAGAFGAAITVDQQCYVPKGAIAIAGSGFTPNAAVAVAIAGTTAAIGTDPTGAFTTTVQAPATTLKHPGAQQFALTATDEATHAVTTAQVDVVMRGVDGYPGRSTPHARITWNLAGFVGGGPVYGHWRFKGKTRATHRMGVPTGPCGVLKVKARQIEANKLRFGLWTVQFDLHRHFTKSASPRATVKITVFKAFK